MPRDEQIDAQKRLWDLAICSFNFENNPARLNRALIKQQICSTTREIACGAATDARCIFFVCFPRRCSAKAYRAIYGTNTPRIFIKGTGQFEFAEVATKKHLKCRNLMSGYSRTPAIVAIRTMRLCHARSIRETI